jgi:hypothetical protein
LANVVAKEGDDKRRREEQGAGYCYEPQGDAPCGLADLAVGRGVREEEGGLSSRASEEQARHGQEVSPLNARLTIGQSTEASSLREVEVRRRVPEDLDTPTGLRAGIEELA